MVRRKAPSGSTATAWRTLPSRRAPPRSRTASRAWYAPGGASNCASRRTSGPFAAGTARVDCWAWLRPRATSWKTASSAGGSASAAAAVGASTSATRRTVDAPLGPGPRTKPAIRTGRAAASNGASRAACSAPATDSRAARFSGGATAK